MIAVEDVYWDFLLHFMFLLLIGVYLRYLVYSKRNTFVGIALVGALAVTYINHRYFPGFRLSRYM